VRLRDKRQVRPAEAELFTSMLAAEAKRNPIFISSSAFGRHRFEAVVVGHFLTTVLVLSCLGFLFFLSFFCELLPLPIGV